MFYPMIGMPQGAEWLVILAIVVLVFGAAKLPDLARGTGQALRIFKTETKGLRDSDDTPSSSAQSGQTSQSGQPGQAEPSTQPGPPAAELPPATPGRAPVEDPQADKHNG